MKSVMSCESLNVKLECNLCIFLKIECRNLAQNTMLVDIKQKIW